jgi:hypothetical protein
MKLRLEFEDSDLREMIQEYFDRNGFAVKNLDQLCELFKKAFPDGIKVDAETRGPREATAAAEVDAPTAVTPPVEELSEAEDPNPHKSNGSANVAMSATDLFDPTPGSVPTRDEQLRQSQQEVANIVAQSKALEEEKAKEDQ